MNDHIALLLAKLKRLRTELGDSETELLRASPNLKDTEPESGDGSGRRERARTHMYQFTLHLGRALLHLPKAIREEVEKVQGPKAEVPEGLARALMLSRSRLDDAVSLAIRQYLDVRADREQLDRWAESIPVDVRKDLVARAKRQVENQVKNLAELGIEICEICGGTPFDPSMHEVVQTESTVYDDDVDTIVRTERPAFVWRDEFGQEQVVPAEVVVFTKATAQHGYRSSELGTMNMTELGSEPHETDASEVETAVATSAA